jgi:hypothetical protein
MPLKELCTPRPSVFAADRRATVLSLDIFHLNRITNTNLFSSWINE